jgi:hypothetical protein
MTTEPSVSEDGRLLPNLEPVYPLAIPCQRTGYSDTYPPVRDELGREKGGRLPGDRAAPRREAERLPLTSNSLPSISGTYSLSSSSLHSRRSRREPTFSSFSQPMRSR